MATHPAPRPGGETVQGSATVEEDEDFQIERDDPTLAKKAQTPTLPLAHSTEDDLDSSTYMAMEEDDG